MNFGVRMRKYKVMVEGVNFLIRVENDIEKLGFFTTRFVEAKDEQEAENLAMDILRRELKTLVQNEESDTPMMFVETIEEIDSLPDPDRPGTGFAWYPDKEKGH